ncbi:MAG TPA: hypothetical protein VF807_09190 [Ktedonobacterales bacterium]
MKQDDSGNVLWLRQSMTVTHEGRERALEVRVPIAVDATPEEVERLVAQANLAMDSLMHALDGRATSSRPELRAVATPAPAPATPQQATPQQATPQPAAATASKPQTPRPQPQATAAPAATGPDLTRPQFLAAAAELGFNAKEAMERLGIRSLEGLHLHEALESLRRMSLREQPDPEPDAVPPAPPATARRQAAPAASFAEEDDPEMTFSLVEESVEPYAPEEPDDYDLADVPSLDDLDGIAPVVSEERARGIIAQMRTAIAGGVTSSDRKTAYANIVVAELGEGRARTLVRGLWKLTPERLGPEQYDAIIRWGKLDTFADEAEAVLTLLSAAPAPSAEQAPSAAPATRTARPARSQARPERL